MRPSIYWLDLRDGWRLAIMPRPRAGDWLDDEIAGWKAVGVNVVVSLIEAHEMEELGLGRLPACCRSAGIELVRFPIPDRGVPASVEATDCLVRRLCGDLAAGKAVAVHCRAGIGRSSLIAACILVAGGSDVNGAFSAIAEARGLAVPDTEAQRAWVAIFLRGRVRS